MNPGQPHALLQRALDVSRKILTAAEQERLGQEVGGVSGRMLLAEARISLVDVATLQ